MKSTLVSQKLEKLVRLAHVEGEVNVEIILLVLKGARLHAYDGLLAEKVQEFVATILLPKLREERDRNNISQN